MKYAYVYVLFLMFVFFTSCGQNKTEVKKNITNSESKGVITSHGPNTSVRAIRQDRKGNIWLASNEGIIRYDGKSFTNVTGNLFPDRFFSVLEDRKGNFWFGNYGSRVYYYDGKSLRNFTTREGLANNLVMSICEDKASVIWFGTGGGVSRYDGKSFRNFSTKDGLPNNGINSIMEDKTGKLWIGAGEPCFYDGKTFTVLKNKDGKAFNNVWSIIEDKKAISGSVAIMAFGAMTAAHLPILPGTLFVMSTKIKKETFGPVVLMTTESLHFPVMMKSHYLIKSQL